MITKEDIQRQLLESFKGIDPKRPETVQNAILELFGFISTHINDLDEEAKKIADSMIAASVEETKKAIEAMPEGGQKKALLRQVAAVKGERVLAATLIAGLNDIPKHTAEKVFADASAIIERDIQRVLDLIEDITKEPQKGPAGFARIGLLFLVVNEAITALLLGQRSLLNQSDSHIRAIHEHLDLVALFTQFPEFANDWLKNEPGSTAWYRLRPSKVRKKLGKPKDDPLYGLLSSLGVHGSFEALRLFISKSLEKEGARPALNVWLGGCPREDQVIWTHLHLMLALQLALVTIYQNFPDRIDKIEAAGIFLAAHADLRKYLGGPLREMLKAAGVDLGALDKYIEGQNELAAAMEKAIKEHKA